MSRLDEIEARLENRSDIGYGLLSNPAYADLRYLLNVARAADEIAEHLFVKQTNRVTPRLYSALRAALEGAK